MTNTKEGWAFPGKSRKAHFFTNDGRSLCLGWGFYAGPLEQGNDDSSDNCAKCKREKQKHNSSDSRNT